MKLLFSNRIFLFPSGLSVLVLLTIYSFPDQVSPIRIVLTYWIFGTLLLILISRILASNMKQELQITQELKQQKQYLENLIEGAPEAIVWGNHEQCIKYVNQKFVEMFGYSREEALGQDIDELLADETRMEEAKAATRAVSNGEIRQFDGIRRKKDGSTIHVSIVGAPLTSLSGKQEAFGLYRDTTEEWEQAQKLIKSESSLRDLSRELGEANNFKELLLDIITHDLRNPAGVISGAVELLESEVPDSEILDLIKGSAHNLHLIIESASTLSKLSMGEDISLEPLDMVPLLQEVARNFESQLEMSGMILDLDLPATLEVNANPIIGEVVSNFLSNGIKYAADGKRLILRAGLEDEQPVISLTDFGATIPEDQWESIFKRRIQLLTGPKRGSGLGLAIVKRIAQAHHASTGIRANQTQGNIFYFKFDQSPED